MNNCPKCGNPLQEGTNNCPICGTNILENGAQAEEPASNIPAPPMPAPAPEMPTTPAVEEAASASDDPNIASTGATTNQNTGILPTVDRVESPTPIPSIPSSLSDQNAVLNPEEKPLVANPKLEPKKPIKKTPIIVGLVLVIVLGIGCFMFLKPSKSNSPKPNNNDSEPTEEVALSSMSSNGYSLKIAEGWSVQEDGNNVILTNNDGTVAIKLEHSKANLSTIKQQDIEDIMKGNSNYQDVQVSEVDVSGRSSFLVATNINNLPVQIYFINGGPELIIGATIVYQSKDTKEKYEAIVMEMIVSLSYADNSVKAIEAMNEYSQMFGIFNNVTINATNKYNNNYDNNYNEENNQTEEIPTE